MINSADKLHKNFDYRTMVEIKLAQQGIQLQNTDSPSVTFHTDMDLATDSPNVHPSSFPTSGMQQGHKTKVAQTIRKQYKHTIEVFEWVSHDDGNCKVGIRERDRE